MKRNLEKTGETIWRRRRSEKSEARERKREMKRRWR